MPRQLLLFLAQVPVHRIPIGCYKPLRFPQGHAALANLPVQIVLNPILFMCTRVGPWFHPEVPLAVGASPQFEGNDVVKLIIRCCPRKGLRYHPLPLDAIRKRHRGADLGGIPGNANGFVNVLLRHSGICHSRSRRRRVETRITHPG